MTSAIRLPQLLLPALVIVSLLSGCATPAPPVHTVLRHAPVRRPVVTAKPAPKAQPVAAPEQASATTAPAAALAATPPPVPQAGGTVPLLGFRPMRGQTGSGA